MLVIVALVVVIFIGYIVHLTLGALAGLLAAAAGAVHGANVSRGVFRA